MAKKIRRKIVKKQVKKIKSIVLDAPLENDEDLKVILNKSDFDKYELDNYLNDFSK